MRRPSLPVARLICNEPSALAVRWVMRSVWLSLVALMIIVAIGHLPLG